MSISIGDFARALKEFLDGLSGGGRSGPPGPPGFRESAIPSQFPPGGIDFIKHDLRVHMSSVKAGYEEVIEMTGAMVVQRTDPYFVSDRRRNIDFKVLSWAATGWSEKLGVAITYVLSEGVEQPVSTIAAETDDGDFPASFNFKVIFDARVNNERVYERLEGRPDGHAFRQVPPSGDRALSPTITRFTDVGEVRMLHPDLGDIVIKPIDCNDRQGETLRELPGRRLVQRLGLGGRQ